MQKSWKLVFTLCGLLMFNPFLTKGESQVIWEDLKKNDSFSFSGYDQIFLAPVFRNQSQEKEFFEILRSSLQKRGKLEILTDPETQIFRAMGKSRLWLFAAVIPTKDPEVNFFQMYASVGAEANYNKTDFTSIVWQRNYLLQNGKQLEQDVSNALKESIPLFISQYFGTNPQGNGKATFYFPNPCSNKN